MLVSTTVMERSAQLDCGTRRKRAVSYVHDVIRELERHGVKLKIFGSLASGSFDASSDIDLLVTECPKSLKYSERYEQPTFPFVIEAAR